MDNQTDLYTAIKQKRWQDVIALLEGSSSTLDYTDDGNLLIYHCIWSLEGHDPLETKAFELLLARTSTEVLETHNHKGETVLQNWLYRILHFEHRKPPSFSIEYLKLTVAQFVRKNANLFKQCDEQGNSLLHELTYYVRYKSNVNSLPHSILHPDLKDYVTELTKLLVEQVPCTKNHQGFNPIEIAECLGFWEIAEVASSHYPEAPRAGWNNATSVATEVWHDRKHCVAEELKAILKTQQVFVDDYSPSQQVPVSFVQLLFKSIARPQNALNYAMQFSKQTMDQSDPACWGTDAWYVRDVFYQSDTVRNAKLCDVEAIDEQGNTWLHHFVNVLITGYFKQRFDEKQKFFTTFCESLGPFKILLDQTLQLNRANKFGTTPEAVWRQFLKEYIPQKEDKYHDYYVNLVNKALFSQNKKILNQAVTVKESLNGQSLAGTGFIERLPIEMLTLILQYLPAHEMLKLNKVSHCFRAAVNGLTCGAMSYLFHPFFRTHLFKTAEFWQKSLWGLLNARELPAFLIDSNYRFWLFEKDYHALGMKQLRAYTNTYEAFFTNTEGLPKNWWKNRYFQILMCADPNFLYSGLATLGEDYKSGRDELARLLRRDTSYVKEESIFLALLANDLIVNNLEALTNVTNLRQFLNRDNFWELTNFQKLFIRSKRKQLTCDETCRGINGEPGIGADYMLEQLAELEKDSADKRVRQILTERLTRLA